MRDGRYRIKSVNMYMININKELLILFDKIYDDNFVDKVPLFIYCKSQQVQCRYYYDSYSWYNKEKT